MEPLTAPLSTVQRRTVLAAMASLPAMASAQAKKPVQVAAAFSLPFHHLWVSCLHLPLTQAQSRGEIGYTAFENVLPGDYAERLRKLAREGAQMILGESHLSDAAARSVAREFPEVAFIWWSLDKPQAPNFSVFENCIHEPAYLAGMLAASLSRNRHVGVVGGFGMRHTMTIMNAFISGAREIDPGIEHSAGVINSWYNPVLASKMTHAMLERKADVFFALTHAGVVETALEHQALAFNGMGNQQAMYPKTVVAAALWHPEPMLQAVLERVRNKTFQPENYAAYARMKSKGSSLSPLSPHFAAQVPEDVLKRVQQRSAQIERDQFTVPRNPHLKMTVTL